MKKKERVLTRTCCHTLHGASASCPGFRLWTRACWTPGCRSPCWPVSSERTSQPISCSDTKESPAPLCPHLLVWHLTTGTLASCFYPAGLPTSSSSSSSFTSSFLPPLLDLFIVLWPPASSPLTHRRDISASGQGTALDTTAAFASRMRLTDEHVSPQRHLLLLLAASSLKTTAEGSPSPSAKFCKAAEKVQSSWDRLRLRHGSRIVHREKLMRRHFGLSLCACFFLFLATFLR